jgi:Fumarylacetoacetate (FAA) hydrolase family
VAAGALSADTADVTVLAPLDEFWAAPRQWLTPVATARPGDLLATGTPAGVGNARTPPWLLRPGDVVEVEVERLGVLRNPVVGNDDRHG